MITICSYCRQKIGEKEPFEDNRLSHGICGACYDYHIPRILEKDMSAHLDRYPYPVIMVDENVRLLGINREMTTFLGKARDEVVGLLGGELLGCLYARLPEGCGKTTHCSTCSIRLAVEKSRKLGKDLVDIPAQLDQETQRVHFRISVFTRGEFAKVVVNEVTGTEPL